MYVRQRERERTLDKKTFPAGSPSFADAPLETGGGRDCRDVVCCCCRCGHGANHGWKGSNHCHDQTHLRLYRIFFFFFYVPFGLSEPMRFHFLLGFPLAPGITTMQHQKQIKKNTKKRERIFFLCCCCCCCWISFSDITAAPCRLHNSL